VADIDIDIEKTIQSVVSEMMAKQGPASAPAAPAAPEANPPDAFVNRKHSVRHVAIGSDHTSVAEKNIISTYLQSLGYHVTDVGTFTNERVDYPDYAVAVAKKVASGQCECGIMLDGAGIGSAIVCNKVRGIRAALCYDMRTVINSREHNNANVLTLGGPMHNRGELCEMTKTWIETSFAGGRHWVRINKMMATERGQRQDGPEGTDQQDS